MKFVFLVYSISLLVVSKAFECPYSQRYGENSHVIRALELQNIIRLQICFYNNNILMQGSHHLEMELKKEPCPHRVPSVKENYNIYS